MLDYSSEEALVQNLMDADCDEATVAEFLECYRRGQLKKGLCLLNRKRAQLIESCHCAQKKVDCLDYMMYRLKHPKKDEE